MSKKAGKKGAIGRDGFINTVQTETYRQQVKKEQRTLAGRTKAEIDRLTPFFSLNNNYLNYSLKEDFQNKEPPVKFQHPLEQIDDNVNNYCQKCKKDKGYCPHKQQKEVNDKDKQKFILTSNQSYGWGDPYDNIVNLGFGLKLSDDSALLSKTIKTNTEKVDVAKK